MPSAEVTIAPFAKVTLGSVQHSTDNEEKPRIDQEKVLHTFENKNDNFYKNVDQAPFSLFTPSVIFRQRGTPYFVSKSDPASYISGSTYWYEE